MAPRPGFDVRALRAQLRGEVDDSPRRRAEYSSDASNYRVPPAAVVFPRSDDDVVAAVQFAAENGIPVTPRGGGTSVAGNAIGPGLVLDFSRHRNAIIDLDPQARTAVVQPGVVLSDLQQAASAYGLRFGPDPSTQNRCTLGGMIGNNACGPRALAWGRTADNVREVVILDGRGTRRTLADDLDVVAGLPQFVAANLALIRTHLGTFDRQASGYALERLLPERGERVARAFVGTEGTCGVLLSAAVELVPIPEVTAVVALGYPEMATAAEDAQELLSERPSALEGLDARLVEVLRAHRKPVPDLPRGTGWLFIEVAGDSGAAARAAAERLCRKAQALDHRIVDDRREAAALWKIRADGAGLAGRTLDGEPAWPGWEDAAVPPARLADYLRGFDELMRDYGLHGPMYGHFGDGCVHVRLDLPIKQAPHRFRAFLLDAARLVAEHGGSLSGEHGDGRARSELLPIIYSPQVLAAFANFKALFDPDNVLNPGVLVDPLPIDRDLRLPQAPRLTVRGMALPHDRGDLSMAAHRCVGVGKCRATGGFMCPSYQATRDDKDSTRGRARVLQEMANGQLVTDGFDDPAVAQSLDLCLSCKACASDCPAGVDMATYKSEVLYRRYRRRLRPMNHYVLGQLPRWLRLGSKTPRLVNALSRRPLLRRWGLAAAGIDSRRKVPALARESFRAWWHHRPAAAAEPSVLLWIDSFTNAFSPEIAVAAVELLESAGYGVRIVADPVCCGLTWITTGQLDGARKRLSKTVEALAEHALAGGLIVGLESSCTAVLRSDLVELLPEDPRAVAVSAAVRTLAEVLADAPRWRPPRLDGRRLVVQPHCHQHAVLGFDADRRLLAQTGANVTYIEGCCGLAGNFGMERGHYEVSVAVAENGILAALRDAPDAVLVADGFSCRTQADQLAGRPGVHLAQLLREATRET
ncbi:FAD-binding oxidoreductase [Skermania sp. ID1734]|uniref:FAD-binding and (Fe-S)-binding domain-containing protein n=1 Tax=Skermania sp. ID1734 TaxID=2597516 RepID=UPI00117FAF82|nr:FAD-binding and (Fe-S)-binding domain-containing protein [Skermania sp. ID1734]TSE00356.1 FAD-binding oxidoreductase [Skermania sp. ID1734]